MFPGLLCKVNFEKFSKVFSFALLLSVFKEGKKGEMVRKRKRSRKKCLKIEGDQEKTSKHDAPLVNPLFCVQPFVLVLRMLSEQERHYFLRIVDLPTRAVLVRNFPDCFGEARLNQGFYWIAPENREHWKLWSSLKSSLFHPFYKPSKVEIQAWNNLSLDARCDIYASLF